MASMDYQGLNYQGAGLPGATDYQGLDYQGHDPRRGIQQLWTRSTWHLHPLKNVRCGVQQ
jgi:hypothetical protein